MIPLLQQGQGLVGVLLILLVAWGLSEDRRRLPSGRWILGALLLQGTTALLIVHVPWVWNAIGAVNHAVDAIAVATRVGSSFMFGFLGGAPAPFALKPGFSPPVIVAFEVLPLVIMFSALVAVLWHWRVLQGVVRGLSWVLQRTLHVSGVVGLNAGANIFLGVVEAPLLIRPYIERLSRSELFAIMVLSMANISGAILVLYAQTLSRSVPDAVAHMIAASVLSLPAALLIARLMVPGDGATPARASDTSFAYENTLDALVRGTLDGVNLFLAVIGIIIVVFACVALVDQILSVLPMVDGAPITLKRSLGWICAPLMWALGVPWSQATTAGGLMGTKAILNEYVAYIDLAALPLGVLSPRSTLIVTYALCSVANLASVGLLVSTIGTLAPARRAEAAALGMRSWIAGNGASAMTGAMIGLITPL